MPNCQFAIRPPVSRQNARETVNQDLINSRFVAARGVHQLPPMPGTVDVIEIEDYPLPNAATITQLVDDELLRACEARSRTSAPRFHRAEIQRLFVLAGSPVRGCLPEWVTVRPPIMDALLHAARSGIAIRRASPSSRG